MAHPEKYFLTWVIDVSQDQAATHEEAAQEARRNFLCGCQVFNVKERGGTTKQVDLVPDWNGTPANIDPLALAAREVVRKLKERDEGKADLDDLANAIADLEDQLDKAGIEV